MLPCGLQRSATWGRTESSIKEAPLSAFLAAPAVVGGFARLAASCCGVEAAVVAMRQGTDFVIAGEHGLRGAAEHLRGSRIFAATVERNDILEVVQRPRPGALAKPGEQHVYRFYAGIALRDARGLCVGVLALLDPYPRMLEGRARDQLRLIAGGLLAAAAGEIDDGEALARMIARSPEPAIVYRLAPDGGAAVHAGNAAYLRAFGLAEAHEGGAEGEGLRGPESDGGVTAAIRGARRARRAMRATIALYPRGEKPRPRRWFEVSGYPVALREGGETFWLESYNDVTEPADRLRAVVAERDRLRATLTSMDDAVVTTDRLGRLQLVNGAARRLLDLRTRGEERRIDDGLLELRDIETEELIASPLLHARREGQSPRRRALIRTHEEKHRYVEYAVAPIERPGHDRDGFVIVLRDVTEEESLTRRLSFEASHDQLTGISNRRHFEQSLGRALVAAKADTEVRHALAFLDLDKFKRINDSCGHAAGDEVLREVARVFKAQLRSHDVIARFGGDEFAILMHDCAIATAARVMQRIRSAIAAYEWAWHGARYTLGVSIGLAEITSQTESLQSVLKEADIACYADKLAHRVSDRRVATVRGEAGFAEDVPWLR